MRFGRLARSSGAALGLAMALSLAACGGSGSGGSSSGPEKTNITVDAQAIPDVAPLYLAIKHGYFEKEGLHVKTKTIDASSQSIPGLAAGTVDFTTLNYASTLETQAKGAVNLRYVADGYQGTQNMWVVLVKKHSPIRSPKDLEGKTIALNSSHGSTSVVVKSLLQSDGMSMHDVKTAVVPFPNMEAALQTGRVDAITVLEPFITKTQQDIGARKIGDVISGSTANLPLSGWATTAQYVKKYPKTVAAFQRAIIKGQRLAAANRKAVEKIIPTYTKIGRQTAAVITLGTYPTRLTPNKVARVQDLMHREGYLHKKLNAKQLVVPPPKS